MSTGWTSFASWSSHHRFHQEVQELSQEVLDMGMFINFLPQLKDEPNVLLCRSKWGRRRRFLHNIYVHFFRCVHCLSCVLCVHYIHYVICVHYDHYIQGSILLAGGNLYLHHARTNAKEVVWRVSSWRVNFRVAAERRGKIRGRGHFFHRRAATKVNGGNWGWWVGFS